MLAPLTLLNVKRILQVCTTLSNISHMSGTRHDDPVHGPQRAGGPAGQLRGAGRGGRGEQLRGGGPRGGDVAVGGQLDVAGAGRQPQHRAPVPRPAQDALQQPRRRGRQHRQRHQVLDRAVNFREISFMPLVLTLSYFPQLCPFFTTVPGKLSRARNAGLGC